MKLAKTVDSSVLYAIIPNLSNPERIALANPNGYGAESGKPWCATIRPHNYKPATRTLLSLERKGLVKIIRGQGKQPIYEVRYTDLGVQVGIELGGTRFDQHGEVPS